jgi:hypothetical protein
MKNINKYYCPQWQEQPAPGPSHLSAATGPGGVLGTRCSQLHLGSWVPILQNWVGKSSLGS